MFDTKKVAKETIEDAAKESGAFIGNEFSKNAQNATNVSIDGMDLLKDVAKRKYNVSFDQKKGNFFEYIEAAKFNRDAAFKGIDTRAVVTDSIGRPHDPVDIELVKNGKVVDKVQAKFSDADNAASQSVFYQAKEKYRGFKRLIRKDEHYVSKKTGKECRLSDEAKRLAKKKSEMPYHSDIYKDTYENLTDEIKADGATSGGTTLEETKEVSANAENYADKFEKEALYKEMGSTAINMAAASAITTGFVSGISNLFQVYKNKKTLSDAMKDVCKDTGIGALRGAGTGIISTSIRYYGMKKGNFLGDSTYSTILASGLLDTGISLYSYVKGDIDSKELKNQIVENAGKTTVTMLFTKAISAIGITTPFVPIAIYTAASFVVKTGKEIIRESKLRTEELNRATNLIEESTKELKEQRRKLKAVISPCDETQKKFFDDFIRSIDYDFVEMSNYDEMLNSIVRFAEQSGIVLKHASFKEFDEAMRGHEVLILD